MQVPIAPVKQRSLNITPFFNFFQRSYVVLGDIVAQLLKLNSFTPQNQHSPSALALIYPISNSIAFPISNNQQSAKNPQSLSHIPALIQKTHASSVCERVRTSANPPVPRHCLPLSCASSFRRHLRVLHVTLRGICAPITDHVDQTRCLSTCCSPSSSETPSGRVFWTSEQTFRVVVFFL